METKITSKELDYLTDTLSMLGAEFDRGNIRVELLDDDTVQNRYGEEFLNKKFRVTDEDYLISVDVFISKDLELHVNVCEDLFEDADDFKSIWMMLYFSAVNKI